MERYRLHVKDLPIGYAASAFCAARKATTEVSCKLTDALHATISITARDPSHPVTSTATDYSYKMDRYELTL